MTVKRREIFGIIFIFFLLSAAVFGRTVSFDFVNLDDPSNLQKNPAMHNLSLAWNRPYLDAYLPLTYTTWWTLSTFSATEQPKNNEIETWTPIPELNPFAFHLVNLLLHACGAVLLYLTLRSLFPEALQLLSGLLAAIFLLHPLQVEALAWVTALKDVLSGGLSLLLIYLFIQKPLSDYRGRRNTTRILCLTAIFLAACFAKSTRVFLPLWLLWLGHLHWKKPKLQVFIDLLPLFVISCVIVIMAMIIQPHPKDMAYQEIWRRPLIAGDALTFYIFKLFWPMNLALDYGRNPRFLFESKQGYWTWIFIALLFIPIWYFRKRINPWLLLGIAGFVIALLPLLGLSPFVFQTISTVSDRYCYLSIALLIIGITPVLAKIPQQKILLGSLCVVTLLLGTRSYLQLPVWRNSFALWQHTFAVTPDSAIAHNNLASIYEELGNTPQAIEHYEKSMLHLPRAETCSRIAILYTDIGNWQQAANWVGRGLKMDPDDSILKQNQAVIAAHLF